jgi:hypothetical protein
VLKLLDFRVAGNPDMFILGIIDVGGGNDLIRQFFLCTKKKDKIDG